MDGEAPEEAAPLPLPPQKPWRRETGRRGANQEKKDADDFFTGVVASLSRTMMIQKIVLLPKFKAAAFFQPEDHIRSSYVKRSSQEGRILPKNQLAWVARAGIFSSGCLLFLGHDLGLHFLHRGEHMDIDHAPVSSSALGGGLGGLLYAACSTPIANYLAGEPLNAVYSGFRYTFMRDVVGFGIYFGCYTWLRHIGHELFEEGVEGATAKGKANTSEVFANLPKSIALSAAAGGGAGLATYIWRSPFDTQFKISRGWRHPDTPLISPRRFITSPRGIKAVAIGAATWGIYEGTWLVLETAASVSSL